MTLLIVYIFAAVIVVMVIVVQKGKVFKYKFITSNHGITIKTFLLANEFEVCVLFY